MIRGGNEGDMTTIGALALKDFVETCTVDDINEITIILVIALEIG